MMATLKDKSKKENRKRLALLSLKRIQIKICESLNVFKFAIFGISFRFPLLSEQLLNFEMKRTCLLVFQGRKRKRLGKESHGVTSVHVRQTNSC